MLNHLGEKHKITVDTLYSFNGYNAFYYIIYTSFFCCSYILPETKLSGGIRKRLSEKKDLQVQTKLRTFAKSKSVFYRKTDDDEVNSATKQCNSATKQ
jgi:hypothetical protein